MRITHQTPTELVVKDSLLWVTVLCTLVATPLLCLGIAPGRHGTLAGAGLFLLFALFGVRKTTFVFDAVHRMVRWNGRKLLKVESGEIPFSDITGIGTEAMAMDKGSVTYRLTILTSQGSVPMAYSYNSGKARYAQMRETILAFLKPGATSLQPQPAEEPNGAALADEDSIRSLLKQGRKIDAITLLRATSKLDLTQAVKRVEEIDAKMNAGN
ncbi:MAG: hypothetical protein ACLP00_27480 [Terracidiphilus sp.]